MAKSGLQGSFPLTSASIDEHVKKTSPGAYALGHTRGDKFYIKYVGRSDGDVNARLKDHVDSYYRFKFEYYGSAKEAFEKECRLYHDFEPDDNDVHPARPAGRDWKCPVCTIFD